MTFRGITLTGLTTENKLVVSSQKLSVNGRLTGSSLRRNLFLVVVSPIDFLFNPSFQTKK